MMWNGIHFPFQKLWNSFHIPFQKNNKKSFYETNYEIRFKPLQNGLLKLFREKKLKFMGNGIRIPFHKIVKRIL